MNKWTPEQIRYFEGLQGGTSTVPDPKTLVGSKAMFQYALWCAYERKSYNLPRVEPTPFETKEPETVDAPIDTLDWDAIIKSLDNPPANWEASEVIDDTE